MKQKYRCDYFCLSAGILPARSLTRKDRRVLNVTAERDGAKTDFVTVSCVRSLNLSLMRWLQLGFDFDSTAVRLLVKGH